MPDNDHEQDYRLTVDPAAPTEFLGDSAVEIIRNPSRKWPPEHVLFDFDGTLSLIREGWPEVMAPMMVEVLRQTGAGESDQELSRLVMGFIMELNGKQTIYQMIRLTEEVRRRGGRPREPAHYKQLYHDRLMQRISTRREALRSGRTHPESMLVPGSLNVLRGLRDRGATLYIASGTDQPFVREEARLLGLDEFFGPRIHGAQDDYKTFSKAKVIERILAENNVRGERLLGFGDGYVEIQNVKAAGGAAVGVASDESGRSGKPDAWKRNRLIGVGADLIIPDYADAERLLGYLWNDR